MAVRLTEKQIAWLVDHLLRELDQADLLRVESNDEESRKTLIGVIRNNLNEEIAIEKEAWKLVEKHGEVQGVDRHKAYGMIKKELAKQKGFIL